MFRNLIILVAIVVLIWVVRGFITRGQQAKKSSRIASQDMVQCGHCGVYLPKNESIIKDDHYFCSKEHLEQWNNRS